MSVKLKHWPKVIGENCCKRCFNQEFEYKNGKCVFSHTECIKCKKYTCSSCLVTCCTVCENLSTGFCRKGCDSDVDYDFYDCCHQRCNRKFITCLYHKDWRWDSIQKKFMKNPEFPILCLRDHITLPQFAYDDEGVN